jgi:hypothetical protein
VPKLGFPGIPAAPRTAPILREARQYFSPHSRQKRRTKWALDARSAPVRAARSAAPSPLLRRIPATKFLLTSRARPVRRTFRKLESQRKLPPILSCARHPALLYGGIRTLARLGAGSRAFMRESEGGSASDRLRACRNRGERFSRRRAGSDATAKEPEAKRSTAIVAPVKQRRRATMEFFSGLDVSIDETSGYNH